MEREFLKGLELDQETQDTIMAEYGKAVQGLKEQVEGHKKRFGEVQEQLKAFEGIEPDKLKGEVTRLSDELATAQANHAAELAKIKRQGETKDFLAGYKFVNTETHDHYFAKLEDALDDDANKGKSRKDILDSFVTGEDGNPRANIFAPEKAPATVVPGIAGSAPLTTPTSKETALQAAQAAMGIKTPKG